MAKIPDILPTKILESFQKENDTLVRAVKDVAEERIEIEIGDSKQPDFKPQFKIKKWDNEVNFSMRAEEDPTATIEIEEGVVKYKAKDYEVHQYELPEAGEDGGFEFEWVLPKKPASNVLSATIQTKELNFFYQPALTAEEIEQGASRPDNIIGSYAVYHKSKRDNTVGGKHYKTGKAFHIYRPKAIDANGVEEWCELNIDEQAGVLTVTVSEDFLQKASYPVVVDPTFGYTTAGASNFGYNFVSPAGTTWAALGLAVSFTEASLVSSLSAYALQRTGHASDPDFRGVITESTTTFEEVFGVTNIGSLTATLNLNTASFPSPVSLGTGLYVLGFGVQDRGFNIRYDSSSGQDIRFASPIGAGTNVTDGTVEFATDLTNNFGWGESATTDQIRSIYVTYTVPGFINGDISLNSGTTGFNISLSSAGGPVEVTRTHTTDSLVLAQLTNTHTIDSFVAIPVTEVTTTHTADSFVKAEVATAYTVDALVKAEANNTHTSDSLVIAETTNDHTTDSLVRYELTNGHTIDSFVIAELTYSNTIDSLVRNELTENHTTDSLVLAELPLEHTSDSLVISEVTNTHTSDALVRDELTNTHTTDSFVLDELTTSHTVDSFVVDDETGQCFLLLENGDTTLLENGSKVRLEGCPDVPVEETNNHTIDSLVKAEVTTTHTADSLVKAETTQNHTTDTLIWEELTNTHTADSLVYLEQETTYTVDSYVAEPTGKLFYREGGVWKLVSIKQKQAGVWQPVSLKYKKAGSWINIT